MILKFTAAIVLMCSLAGCSTTRKLPVNTGHLQIRVEHMENQLDAQSQEIMELRSSVEDLTSRIHRAVSTPPPVRRIARKAEMPSVQTSKPKSQKILRVPVSPQEVQRALKNAGYYNGAIDGKLGSGSQRGIKEFQTDHDLESDGIIGKKTWGELKNYLE